MITQGLAREDRGEGAEEDIALLARGEIKNAKKEGGKDIIGRVQWN